MKNTIARFFLFLAAFTSAFAQPMIPVNNISPVNANSLIGNIGASGRAENITLGAGLSFVGGALVAGSGGGSAPADGTYITQIPNATLTNEQPLSLLATGLVYVTTSTGVLSSIVPGAIGNVVISNGTAWVSSLPAGNVTAAATLTSGNILLGQGGKAVASSSVFTISGSDATVTGNLTITGSTTFNNLTTANLTVTGNITATGVGNGTLLIGNTTGSKFNVATLTAGDGVSITNGAGTITINATGGAGTVTASGTPTSGQLAEWTSATNLQGISTAGVTQGGSGRATGTTAYSIIATGTTATGAQQTLANGATTEILVGGGAAALPVWTTASGTGAPARVGSPAFTGNIVLASGTGPTTGAVAATAFDTDAWAASRGAVQVHDGTANTYVVAAQASDTPSNGQVPTWNTGGTVTWETPTGGSGTPGGSTTQVQYNNAGAFGGITGATTNGTSLTTGAGNLLATEPQITTGIRDSSGLLVLAFNAAATAVNRVALTNSAAGSPVIVSAEGSDTDISILNSPKGAGGVRMNGTAPAFVLQRSGTTKSGYHVANATDNIITGSFPDDTAFRNYASGNFIVSTDNGSTIAFKVAATASQANGIQVTPNTSANAATIGGQISAIGTDSNVAITLTPKGTGIARINNANPALGFLVSGTFKNSIRSETTAGSDITGSAVDDMCFRNYASKSFLFSTDNGTSAHLKLTANNGTAVFASAVQTSQTGGIIGTTTNNSANAGSVGEYVNSLVASGSAVSLTTATAANVTSISLTAGDWDVSGIVNYTASAATVTATSAGITSTSATVPTDGSEGYSGVQLITASATDSVTLCNKRMSLSGTTTVYLVASRTFSVGTTAAFGTINARRVR